MKEKIKAGIGILYLLLLLLCNNWVVGQDKSSYPDFSWEKVPVAFHFGNNSGLMTKEQAQFVTSHSNIICLEKAHAIEQFGNTEDGIEKETQQLKSLNPNMKVIFYWNTFLDYNLYKAHDEYEKHPEWWLRKQDGELDFKNNQTKRYDLSNPEVRKWWVEVAKNAVINGNSDGIFMDAFPQIAHSRNIELWGQQKYNEIQKGLEELIDETRLAIGEDKLVIYNGIRSTPTWNMGFDYPECDAAMMEHFGHFQSTSKECMLKDIQEMEKAGKDEKMVFFKAWPGYSWLDKNFMALPLEEKQKIARDNITFPLAAFLIGAQENCYFTYSWGYRMHMGCLEWYPEFDIPLGKPLGDAKRNGWEFIRDFEHLTVWVNLETKKARISKK